VAEESRWRWHSFVAGAQRQSTVVTVGLESVVAGSAISLALRRLCNLYSNRTTDLSIVEWMQWLLCREEMVYRLPCDIEEFIANGLTDGGAINRFADDWVTLRLMSTFVNYPKTKSRLSFF
jgi:hypothetical protein